MDLWFPYALVYACKRLSVLGFSKQAYHRKNGLISIGKTADTSHFLAVYLLGNIAVIGGNILDSLAAVFLSRGSLVRLECSRIQRVSFGSACPGKDAWWVFVAVWVMLLFVPANWLSGLHVFMYPYFVTGYLLNKWRGSRVYNQ